MKDFEKNAQKPPFLARFGKNDQFCTVFGQKWQFFEIYDTIKGIKGEITT